jgi:hypothetical protein
MCLVERVIFPSVITPGGRQAAFPQEPTRITEQTKELSALGQKIAGESAEPIARNVNQAFKKAS